MRWVERTAGTLGNRRITLVGSAGFRLQEILDALRACTLPTMAYGAELSIHVPVFERAP